MAGLPEAPIRLCGAAAAVNPRLPPGGLLERLLAALVLAGADGLRRDELVELLWPDQPPTDPGRALNPLLSRLRQAVGVVEGRGVVRLGSLSIAVDLREALLLLARARAGEDPATVHAAARDAAAILAGPLLPEHADPWTIDTRRAVMALRAEALTLSARAGVAAGELDGACEAARTLVAAEPLHEAAVELLMAAHVARGEEPEALQAYEALRCRLRDELGVVPGRRLRERHTAVLRGLPPERGRGAARHGGAMPLPPGLQRERRIQLVGREAELEQLAEALAGPHSTALTIVAGAPGIGKTRLVAEAAARRVADGATVLFGRCRVGTGAPFSPVVDAIRPLVLAVDPSDLERELGDLLADLGRLVPAVHRRLKVPHASSGGDPDTTRYRQFEAVSALLGLAGAEAPLLLILDDAQWLDGSTVQLVDHLLRSSQLPRLTVAVTARRAIDGTPAPVRVLRDAAGPRASTSLDLGPLGLEALGELVEAHAPSLGVDSAAEAARLLERTGGSPLFALAELRAGPGTSGDLADTVVASLDAAGPEVRELVELLAVDGGRAELHVLARACGVEVERVARLVDIAEQAGLVHALTAAGTMHDAVREATLGGIGSSRRAVMHGRMALAYEEAYADDPGVVVATLAEHWGRADGRATSERAALYGERAARQALQALAYEQAAVLAREAGAQHVQAGGDDARRIELLLLEADALNRASALVAARRPLAEALALARRIGRGDLVARSAIAFGGHRLSPGLADDELRAALEAGLAAVPPGDLALRARLTGRLAAALLQGPADRRAVLAEEAVELARASSDPRALAETLLWRHQDLLALGDPAGRAPLVEEARALAIEFGFEELALHGRMLRFGDLLEAGRVTEAREEHRSWQAEADGARVAYHRWAAAVCRPTVDLLDGDVGAANAGLDHSAGLAVLLGADPVVVSGQQSQRLVTMMFGGQAGTAADLIGAVIAEHGGGAPWRAALAGAAAVAGRHEEARVQVEHAVADGLEALADPNRIMVLSFLALAGAVAGASPAALRVVRAGLAERPDGLVVQHYGAAVHGAVAVRIALCDVALAELPAAREALARAEGVLGPAPPAMLAIDRDHAAVRLLVAEGGRGAACAPAAAVAARAEALGLAGYAALLRDAVAG